MTLIVIGGLIGGSGVAIMYDGINNPQIIATETTQPDGTVVKTYKDNGLQESQLFNIWLGAVLGYGGAIITFLYQTKDN